MQKLAKSTLISIKHVAYFFIMTSCLTCFKLCLSWCLFSSVSELQLSGMHFNRLYYLWCSLRFKSIFKFASRSESEGHLRLSHILSAEFHFWQSAPPLCWQTVLAVLMTQCKWGHGVRTEQTKFTNGYCELQCKALETARKWLFVKLQFPSLRINFQAPKKVY